MEVNLEELQLVIKTSQCSVCNNLLSVPPIMSKIADGGDLCGRCINIIKVNGEYVKNILYEDIACCLSFPCIYAGCKAVTPWNDVENHERTCTYRMIECPMRFRDCEDFVQVSQLHSHFIDKHERHIQYDNVEVAVKNPVDNIAAVAINLLVINNHQFITYVFNENGLEDILVYVFSVGLPGVQNKCNVKLNNHNDGKYSVSLEDHTIVEYMDRVHCPACIRRICSSKLHPYSLNYDNSKQLLSFPCAKFKKTSTLSILNQPEAIMFKIFVNVDAERGIRKRKKYLHHSLMKKIKLEPCKYTLKALQCCNCNDFKANLHLCYRPHLRHPICSTCKNDLDDCPACGMPIDDNKQIFFEILAKSQLVRCLYVSLGCIFSGDVESVKAHVNVCPKRNLLQ